MKYGKFMELALLITFMFMGNAYADAFPRTEITSTSSTSPYATTKNAFKDSSSQTLTGQCTWYVYGRIMELVAKGELDSSEETRFRDAFWGRSGRDAKNWKEPHFLGGTWHCTQNDVLPIQYRQKGLIAVWESNTHGHVGFVEEVSSDKKRYRLSDFNRKLDTKYQDQWYRFDSSDTSAGGLDDVLFGNKYPCFQTLKLANSSSNPPNPPQLGDMYNDYKGISIADIQAFLEQFNGDLGDKYLYNRFDLDENNFYQKITDWNLAEIRNGVSGMSPAEIIYYSAKENNINPVLLLAKIQQEQSLIEQSATQRKLNRATGYGIPNSNPDGDPKYKSFLAQLTGLTYQFHLFREQGLAFRDAYDTYTVDNTGQDTSFSNFMAIYEKYAVLMDEVLGSSSSDTGANCTNESLEQSASCQTDELQEVRIIGSSKIEENSCQTYQAFAYYAGTNVPVDITNSTAWYKDNKIQYMPDGELCVESVSGKSLTLSISYPIDIDSHVVPKENSKVITIVPKPPVLEDISIKGPLSINESECVNFTAVFVYSDGNTKTIEQGTNDWASTKWSTNEQYASIASGFHNGGEFCAKPISKGVTTTVSVDYTSENGTILHGEKQILIQDTFNKVIEFAGVRLVSDQDGDGIFEAGEWGYFAIQVKRATNVRIDRLLSTDVEVVVLENRDYPHDYSKQLLDDLLEVYNSPCTAVIQENESIGECKVKILANEETPSVNYDLRINGNHSSHIWGEDSFVVSETIEVQNNGLPDINVYRPEWPSVVKFKAGSVHNYEVVIDNRDTLVFNLPKLIFQQENISTGEIKTLFDGPFKISQIYHPEDKFEYSYTAPLEAGEYELRLEINPEGTGRIPESRYDNNVRVTKVTVEEPIPIINEPPSGTPNPVDSENPVNLSVVATSPNGKPNMYYYWIADCPGLDSNGSFDNKNNQNPIWTAPLNDTGKPVECSIKVVLMDGGGWDESRYLSVTVNTEVAPVTEEETIRLAVVNVPSEVAPGESFDITLQFVPDTAQPADGIEVYIEFDPSKLQVNSVTNSGVLDFELKNVIGDGFINFAAASWSNDIPTEAFDLFTINVTALENTDGANNTALHFVTDKSKVTSSGEYIPQTFEDIIINFANPVAKIRLEPTALSSFGEIALGETSTSQSLTIHNEGDAALTIEAFAEMLGFAVEHDCDNAIEPGKSCQMSISFSPTEVKDYTAILAINSNANNGNQEINLSGIGMKPPMLCKVSLQGRPTPPDPSWITDLRIKVNGNEATTTTDNAGQCEFPETLLPLAEGTHQVCVKNAHTLQNKVEVTLPLTVDVIDFGELLEGDINDDNVIQMDDFSLLRSSKDKSQGDDGFNINADFNADGRVDDSDANLLGDNLMKPGQACQSTRRGHRLESHLRRRAVRDGKADDIALRTSPIPIGLEAGRTFEFDIEVSTEAGVDAVATYLNFPPDQIQVNSLKPGESFDFVLQNEFDNIKGYINFAAGVWENALPTGVVTLVTVNATVLAIGTDPLFTFNTEFPRATQAAFGGQIVLESHQEGEIGEIVTAVIEGDYTAYGTIRDELGNPIAGVTLQVGEKTAVTDIAGNWEINGLPGGEYTVTATKAGYLFVPFEVGLGNVVRQEVAFKSVSDLQVNIMAEPRYRVNQGENVTYTITVMNGGDETATGVVLSDVLPENVELLSIEALDGGNCDAATVTCSLPDLTTGNSARVKLVISNNQGNRLDNRAKVTSNEYPTDVDEKRTYVTPHLAVTMSCTPKQVALQSPLHCTAIVELSSLAPSDATGVELVMTSPNNVELQSLNTNNGLCDTSGWPTVVCTLTDLSVDSAEATSMVTVEMENFVIDPGLLVLKHEAKVSANEYGIHKHRARNTIFVDDIKVDIAFVIDVTGSMQQEINGIIKALTDAIAEIDPNNAPLIGLVTFRDEDEVELQALTNDLAALVEVIGKLKASGGGTCHEASVEALNLVIPHVKDGGSILFATDASPYPDADVNAIIEQLRAKSISFNGMITGDCTDKSSWNNLP